VASSFVIFSFIFPFLLCCVIQISSKQPAGIWLLTGSHNKQECIHIYFKSSGHKTSKSCCLINELLDGIQFGRKTLRSCPLMKNYQFRVSHESAIWTLAESKSFRHKQLKMEINSVKYIKTIGFIFFQFSSIILWNILSQNAKEYTFYE